MNGRASGQFEVTLTPLPASERGEIGRMSIDKRFSGELTGTSRGEMLMAGTAIAGSAGYVAIERVSGTLAGRTGSFVLQHSGLMKRGDGSLTVTVVPDSGAEGFAGIAGTMTIEITGGRHQYALEYSIDLAR